MAKRLWICAPHHSSSEGPEERPVVVIVTELSGRSTLWRLPRLGTVEHLRVLLSHPDEGLTSLDVAGLDGARSLASFDVCGEDAMVLELQDCFERDARVTVTQRVEYPFLQGLFGLLDYRTSVPRGGELLRRVEPGFSGIPRECAEYRLEISRALNSPRRAVVAEEPSLDGAGIYV
jgi:hypothetical protein